MFINMSNNSHEIVYEGWLTKSPPSKRVWKARWRRRWFVLRHSGELPGQFFLQYYTEKSCRKLKGTIDLDQCEQVDAGLRFENSKHNYLHMFDVKTPKRTYYLAAESELDMNRWVDCVCQVCGLKATHDDTSVEFTEEGGDLNSPLTPSEGGADTESPPVSPASSLFGPYIPISECISGKPLNTPLGISDFNNIISRQGLQSLDPTLRLNPKDYHAQSLRQNKLNNVKQTICADDISKTMSNKPVTLVMAMPKASMDRLNSLYGDKNILTNAKTKETNIESAKKMAEKGKRPPDLKLTEPASPEFYDSPRKIVLDVSEGVPPPNWSTFPNPEEADFSPGDIGSWSVVQRFGKLRVVDSKLPIVTNSLNRNVKTKNQPDTYSLRRAPPRPPKPSYLLIPESAHNYLNLERSDETYDIPRSHQGQGEEEGAEKGRGEVKHSYSNAAPTKLTGNVFRYDFTEAPLEEPTSPRSEGSGSGVFYSNLPSPLVTGPGVPTPPAVNRELKPTRKMSDSGNSSEPSPGPFTPLFGGGASPGGPLAMSGGSAEPSPGGLSVGPPSIDRTLKPKKVHTEGVLTLCKPPESSLSLRRVRAGPSPVPNHAATLPSSGRSKGSSEDDPRTPDCEPIYFYESKPHRYIPEIQYLDLDHESDSASVSTPGAAEPRTTVYKTVDFLKTEAFNRTRQEVEEERNKCTD